MDSIIGQTIDYKLLGRGSERPAAHTQRKFIDPSSPPLPPWKLATFSSIKRVMSGVVRSGRGEVERQMNALASLQSMAELDEISCVQSQFYLCAPRRDSVLEGWEF